MFNYFYLGLSALSMQQYACMRTASKDPWYMYDGRFLDALASVDCRFTGRSSRGEITKNNKCGSIIKDDNFMITCADRSTLMAGLIKLPHILGFKFISPQLLGPVISHWWENKFQDFIGIAINWMYLRDLCISYQLSTACLLD